MGDDNYVHSCGGCSVSWPEHTGGRALKTRPPSEASPIDGWPSCRSCHRTECRLLEFNRHCRGRQPPLWPEAI